MTAEVLRLRVARHRTSAGEEIPPDQRVVLGGVEALLTNAERAVAGRGGGWHRVSGWWRGASSEAAYLNLHAAEVQMITLYDEAEVEAEVPEAAARLESGLRPDDRRRSTVQAMYDLPPGPRKRAALRAAVEAGFALADARRARVRALRNLVLLTALLLTGCAVAVLLLSAAYPEIIVLCVGSAAGLVCPAGGTQPSVADVGVVLLLGTVGGALGAAVSLRGLRGTSTPYDLPLALSLLKVPAGALTALVGLLVLRGGFVPGLTQLDSEAQVLAYAIVFGYAQQLFTRFIDVAAADVLDDRVSSSAANRGEGSKHASDDSAAPSGSDESGAPPPARVNYRGTVGARLNAAARSSFLVGRLEVHFWPDGAVGPHVTASGPVSVQDGADAEHAVFELTLLVDGTFDVYPRTQTVRVPVRQVSKACAFTVTRSQPDDGLLAEGASGRWGGGALLLDIAQGGRSLQVLEISQSPVRESQDG